MSIFVINPYAFAKVPLSSFTFVDSSTATNTNSITVPATAQAGDLAIIADNINTISADPGAPTGWNSLRGDFVSGNVGGFNYYKILTSGDVGASVASKDTSTTDHFMVCLVFRPNTGAIINSVIINGAQGQATTANPTLQTLASGSGTPPLVAFFAMMQRGSNNLALNITTTPTNDGSATTLDESSRAVLRVYYKFYNTGSTPANLTGDIGDNGAQVLQCWYLTFT